MARQSDIGNHATNQPLGPYYAAISCEGAKASLKRQTRTRTPILKDIVLLGMGKPEIALRIASN